MDFEKFLNEVLGKFGGLGSFAIKYDVLCIHCGLLFFNGTGN